MLIDYATIYVSAGKGGSGCQSLYKDYFHRRGVPDGGDGGKGGDIIFESDTNLHTLLDFKYNQHWRAEKGKNGSSNKKTGKCGKDVIVKVPVGTIIKDKETGFIVRDLAHSGEHVIVARGGAGGKGNAKLRVATPGEIGESKVLILELKLVADVGVIGLPNAGKSTLVTAVSNAHSKIAAYPFTTLNPELGVVNVHDGTFVIVDMPGLIEGAHKGRGLGDKFLKHIERTSMLVHIVDMAPVDGSDPVKNFFLIENELQVYSKDVHKKVRIIAANKMDIPASRKNLVRFISEIGKDVYPISALKKTGLVKLTRAIYKEVQNVKAFSKEDNG